MASDCQEVAFTSCFSAYLHESLSLGLHRDATAEDSARPDSPRPSLLALGHRCPRGTSGGRPFSIEMVDVGSPDRLEADE